MHASGGRDSILLVRLAVIGPCRGDVSMLARMADVVLNGAAVSRAIYLGADDAVDETVALWAKALVGPDLSHDPGISVVGKMVLRHRRRGCRVREVGGPNDLQRLERLRFRRLPGSLELVNLASAVPSLLGGARHHLGAKRRHPPVADHP